jgi:hypothetical protein
MILSAHLADSEESTFKVEESRAAALQAIRRLFQERADIMEAAAQQVGATIVWADGLEAASA